MNQLDRLLELEVYMNDDRFMFSDNEKKQYDSLKKEIQEKIEKFKDNSSECGLYWCYCGRCVIQDPRKIVSELQQENQQLKEQVKLLDKVEKILLNYCGETGQNEGLIETLTRKLEQIKQLKEKADKWDWYQTGNEEKARALGRNDYTGHAYERVKDLESERDSLKEIVEQIREEVKMYVHIDLCEGGLALVQSIESILGDKK